jgi:hypothetical protein
MRIWAEAIVGHLLEQTSVVLLPFYKWRSFQLNRFGEPNHGRRRLFDPKRVDPSDIPVLAGSLARLNNITMSIPIGEWILKMPMRYGITGNGNEGRSVLGKKTQLLRQAR